MEGELARSIRTMSGVRAARVHLVLPKREPFARDRQAAQASVLLTLAGARTLDQGEVAAILNLVSAAVPGLRADGIAIVDSRGNLLAKPGDPAAAASSGEAGNDVRLAAERRLSRAVEEMLERSLGAGHVRAEAAVEMDFSQVHETEEKFDPDGQVVRSTQTNSDTSKTTDANSTVSVQNNLPNGDAGATGSGSQQQKQEETTNYEIGKTVRTMVREQPQIRRISLAVLVDGTDTVPPDAKPGAAPEWKERPPEELERIGRLVRSAIGYDEKRGDRVEVVSMRFAADQGTPDSGPAGLFGLSLGSTDVTRLVQIGLVALVALLGILTVLRPMALRLSAAIVPERGAALALVDATGSQALLEGPANGDHGTASSAPDSEAGMIRLLNIEGQMRSGSLRSLAEVVERYPEASLSIVRDWMHQRETV